MEDVFGREELNRPIDSERLNNLFSSEQKHKEQKDELKNRIGMALKDPILQQGFEIICKNLDELEKRLSVLLSCKNCPDNKGGYICQKEYEDKCLAQKIQYIKELKEEKDDLLSEKNMLESQIEGEKEYISGLNIQKMTIEKNLTKAKHIIIECIDVMSFHDCEYTDAYKEAEDFILKDSEVEK